MTKRIIKTVSLLIAILMVMGLAVSCSKKEDRSENKINIVTTVFPPYDFAKQIGGDNVCVSMLIGAGEESHSYEPTPADIIAVEDCDLFIYIGGHEEKWAEDILDSVGNEINVLCLRDLIPEEKMQKAEGDGHIWTSPKNALLMADGIKDALVKADEKNASLYEENANEYKNALGELDAFLKDAISSGTKDKVIFADRFPFKHLACDYGLNYDSAYPNCEENSEASGTKIAELIETVKKENIPYVFHIEFSSQDIADIICAETGAQKMLLHTAHTVSAEDLERGITYIDIYRQNAENIMEALS